MRVRLLATILTTFLVSGAFAAEEFYVVQNPKTGNCKLSNKKDDGTNVLIGTAGYATADEAKAAKAAAPECKEGKNKDKKTSG